MSHRCSSGEAGIRTLGRIAPTSVFETDPIGRSGTSPYSHSIVALPARKADLARFSRASFLGSDGRRGFSFAPPPRCALMRRPAWYAPQEPLCRPPLPAAPGFKPVTPASLASACRRSSTPPRRDGPPPRRSRSSSSSSPAHPATSTRSTPSPTHPSEFAASSRPSRLALLACASANTCRGSPLVQTSTPSSARWRIATTTTSSPRITS